MSLKISYINEAILFLQAYRNFENSDIETNETFIKRIISPEWIAEHLCDSLGGEGHNFGGFFLNLDHTIQGDFISSWGINVDGLQKYKEEQQNDPEASLFEPAPVTIMWLHGLVKYFYNNGIVDKNDLVFPNLPPFDKRYGNSSNWGNYILSLSSEDREFVLQQLYTHVMSKLQI